MGWLVWFSHLYPRRSSIFSRLVLQQTFSGISGLVCTPRERDKLCPCQIATHVRSPDGVRFRYCSRSTKAILVSPLSLVFYEKKGDLKFSPNAIFSWSKFRVAFNTFRRKLRNIRFVHCSASEKRKQAFFLQAANLSGRLTITARHWTWIHIAKNQ